MSVTSPRLPSEPSSVVIVAVRPVRRDVSAPKTRSPVAAPSRKSTEHRRSRSRAGQREQGRAAVAAADQQAADRVARNRERPAQRAGDIQHVPGPALRQPPGSPAARGEDELHGAAMVGAHVVDRERPPQQHGGVRAADRHRHELAGPEPGRHARRHHRHRVVGVNPADRQHRPADLDRARLHLAACAGHGCAPGAGPAPRSRAACSCNDRTPTPPELIASMPCTAAASPAVVVMQGIPRRTAAVRIS